MPRSLFAHHHGTRLMTDPSVVITTNLGPVTYSVGTITPSASPSSGNDLVKLTVGMAYKMTESRTRSKS